MPALPDGWSPTKPTHHRELGQWFAYTRDTRYRKQKSTPPFVEAAGAYQERALRELARCIVETLEGRMPK
jgi:hypothetical protein